jgi:Heavy metal associated domain 2
VSHYIHRVPGRIRVQIPTIRRNVAVAEEAKGFLESISGITFVKANVLTGSLLIRYDDMLTSAEAILNRMILKGYLTQKAPPSFRPTQPTEVSTFSSELGRRTMDVLCSTVIQTVIETIVLKCLAL